MTLRWCTTVQRNCKTLVMSGCHNSTPGGPGKPASPVKSKTYDEITQQQTNKKNTTDHRITFEKVWKKIIIVILFPNL